ncbi:cell envelope integrity protein CreD [Neisseria sp. Ec49-e6-T10]|uniref:cell envelope integrity protein CreD n=1 Tax=Neisseria sp. Ec49-e6-T10 TaxID=3140744 RepID=UPI003EC00704
MLKRLSVVAKLAVIGVIIIILVVLSNIIYHTISERAYYKNSVLEKIAQSNSGPQRIIGPILVLPFKYDLEQVEVKTGKKRWVPTSETRYVLPEKLSVDGDIQVKSLKLGIYQGQLYTGDLSFNGQFGQINYDDLKGYKNLKIDPYVMVMVSDPRGIIGLSTFNLNKSAQKFDAGVNNSRFSKGVHAPFLAQLLNTTNDFDFVLSLQGTSNLSVVPLGKESEFSLTSNWPHPSFIGNGVIAPESRSVDAQKGFDAKWKNTWYANNLNEIFVQQMAQGGIVFEQNSYSNDVPSFAVNLIETVDQYQLNERSVKYALLFIGLTFIGFFLFEVMSKVRVHPVQYGLVGTALVLFYLILLAFSEQIGFFYAYICAALACSILIGFYLSAVLKSLKYSLMFTSGLLALYALLYFILQSEDNALFLGSILLFVVLAVIMLITRKIDWYQLSSNNQKHE